MTFRAILLNRDEQKNVTANLTQVSKESLLQQEGDTLIKVEYSTLNYKDALALTNRSPVVRVWPMIPGIDCVGSIVETKNSQYEVGDHVILNGWGVGETHWGCLAEYAYLKSDWLIPLPANLSSWQAMAIGTAGYTASLCVLRLINANIKPTDGAIIVTGATGGVGSIAVMLLAKLGYAVTAVTGKMSSEAYLKQLGAKEVIDRQSLSEAGKPLQKECWAGAVDTIGSHTLANVCAQMQYGGTVAACGLAQGFELTTTVMPFILRGVTLAGVDSVMATAEKRKEAWSFLAQHLDTALLENMAKTISLNSCLEVAEKIMAGQITGRYVVDVNKQV